jgi:methanol metabolism-related c-type cytochrome
MAPIRQNRSRKSLTQGIIGWKPLEANLVLRSLPACLAIAMGAVGLWCIAPASAQEEKPYSVVGGKVDKGTFNGYRRYTDACMRCHGPDGAGSSYAPDLTNSLKTMPYEAFTEVVINGRQNVTGTQKNVMPSFGNSEDVALYIDDIYGYLKARSDGVVGRGRPARQ